MSNPKIRVSQCWYTADQYAEVKSMMEDGHLLPSLYAHWLEGAEQREEQARAQGRDAIRVLFDTAEFRRFCKHFSIPLNADSRAKFAAINASQDNGNLH